MDNTPKRRALGRGLDALLPQAPAAQPATPARPARAFEAKIEELHPNRSQPRTRFDDAALNELAESLKSQGMLEPILVRNRAGGGFEIVAGERRWRAAQRAGLHEVPIFVRELTEEKAFEAALVENLQREELNPLETARAFQRLIDEHGRNQDEIAKLIGKDRSTIANALRLLKLPDVIIDRIEARELSEGHGRALLGAGDVRSMEKLARAAVEQGWSVRETERQARRAAAETQKPAGGGQPATKSANVRDLESRLTRSMGTRVTVADRKGKGNLQIAFSSYDELDRILEILLK